MKRVVLDANVIIKWALPYRDAEADMDSALSLLQQFRSGSLRVIQPPHWLAEVSAVLVRLKPEAADSLTADLTLLKFGIRSDPDTYRQAVRLAAKLRHHLFDTLYHAVALLNDATMVTADDAYYRKAKGEGHIVRLSDYHVA